MADTKQQTSGVQGGTHEQHVEAGRQSHKNHPAASAHHEAASRHEAAAHSHRQAAQHHETGNDTNAQSHATEAHSHSTNAHETSTRAHGTSHGTKTQGGTPEQHAEAGRKGGQH